MSYFLVDEFENMDPYVPGEQPKDKKYIKLNANETIVPPSPKVLEAITEEAVNKMGLYSDPTCLSLRTAIAKQYDVDPEQVFVGNGADEVLGFILMSFFCTRQKLCCPDITYEFYKGYANTYRVNLKQFPVNDDFSINIDDYVNTKRDVILANPNNPTGLFIPKEDIERIVKVNPKRMVIIDEAYIDFAGESCVSLVNKYKNLVVVHTYSKSRNLAGARRGYAISSKEIIHDLRKIKFCFNPFNLSKLSLLIGAAAIEDNEYKEKCVKNIVETREYTKKELDKLGFKGLDTKTNFVFVTHDKIKAEDLFKELKNRGILVRYYKEPKLNKYLRITIGTEVQMEQVINTIKDIMKDWGVA